MLTREPGKEVSLRDGRRLVFDDVGDPRSCAVADRDIPMVERDFAEREALSYGL